MKLKRILLVIGLLVGIIIISTIWLLYSGGQLGGKPGRQNQLFVAIWRGETNKVAALLASGADPNGPSRQLNRPTPLIDATKFGELEIVQLLLDKNADPNKPDYNGLATLYYALTSPYLGGPEDRVSYKIVEMLLAHGAAVSGKGVIEAINNLPTNDPRLAPCKQALAKLQSEQKTTNTPSKLPQL